MKTLVISVVSAIVFSYELIVGCHYVEKEDADENYIDRRLSPKAQFKLMQWLFSFYESHGYAAFAELINDEDEGLRSCAFSSTAGRMSKILNFSLLNVILKLA